MYNFCFIAKFYTTKRTDTAFQNKYLGLHLHSAEPSSRDSFCYSKILACFFKKQIKRLKRKDILALNHRSSEFFASYFDLLFALNEQLHLAKNECCPMRRKLYSFLPQDFEANIQAYLKSLSMGQTTRNTRHL